MFCIVCGAFSNKNLPAGLCRLCKDREDSRYCVPEIPINREENRGRKKGGTKGKRNRYLVTNPIILYLEENGSSLREWARDNGESRSEVSRVINRTKINKRLRKKLEEQGLWELLLEAENGQEKGQPLLTKVGSLSCLSKGET